MFSDFLGPMKSGFIRVLGVLAVWQIRKFLIAWEEVRGELLAWSGKLPNFA